MKCLGTFLLIFFFSALVMAQRATIVQPSITVSTATPVSLGVEFHPGETMRYTFSLEDESDDAGGSQHPQRAGPELYSASVPSRRRNRRHVRSHPTG